MLDRRSTGAFADHHDVRVGAVAQEAGHGGLRQHQQIVAFRELRQHVTAQSQHTEPTGRIDRGLTVTDLAALVPQQHEVSVGQPAQQRRDVLAVRAGEPALVIGVEFGRQAAQRGRHRRRVHSHLTGVGQHAGQQTLDLLQRLWVGRFGQLDMDPRLVDAVTELGVRRRLDLQQFPTWPAPHPEHRIHDGLVGHPEPVQQHGHGIHQHRRVVGDDLQRGTESRGVVLGVDGNPGVAEGPVLTESVVGVHQDRRRQPAQCGPVHRRGHHRVGPGRVTVRPAVGRHVGPRQPGDLVLAQRRTGAADPSTPVPVPGLTSIAPLSYSRWRAGAGTHERH